jgi:hypothetical protein
MFAVAILVAATPSSAWAQGREVTGKVTAFGSGAPLADATVGIAGAQIGARTNADGVYKLRVPAGEITIVARAIGYKRNTVRISAGASTQEAQRVHRDRFGGCRGADEGSGEVG